MKKLYALILAVAIFSLPGCLVVSKVSYSISMKTKKTGTVSVKFFDIRSDAPGNREFEDDKKNLFDYMLKSDDFLYSMKSEGKNVTSRKLDVYDNKLNGVAIYDFTDIEKIEGIRFNEGYYYLTLQAEDSVLYTNGEIIKNDEYQRIIWKEGTPKLEFEFQSGQAVQETRDLISIFRSLPK
ncbi:MAG: hypothetical protein LWX56_08145 [Ignavibacteria bacterium]|nr:hypothetical protein [Ignavibacteria bacterium]